MDKQAFGGSLEALLQASPFEVTGGVYVIARHTTGPFGNTVMRCFPIRVEGGEGKRDVSAEQMAELLVAMLNKAFATPSRLV